MRQGREDKPGCDETLIQTVKLCDECRGTARWTSRAVVRGSWFVSRRRHWPPYSPPDHGPRTTASFSPA